MKIAVTHSKGKVFEHFGHTEEFKLYEIEDKNIISCQVISADGEGHGALAGFLADKDVDVLICGGLGEGARTALANAGIEVCSGASGNTDDAVEAYLGGELVSQGVNCDHHGHHSHDASSSCGSEDSGCGSDGCGSDDGGCGSGCGGGCGGCGGGCGGGAPRIVIEGPNAGKTCKVHYKGTFDDGTQFDSSYDRGEPLEFVCGAGMMIPGFDRAVASMEVGQIIDVHLMPEDAYGYPDPRMIFTVRIEQMPGSEELVKDQKIYLQNQMGQPFPATVIEKDDETITFDANSEMAGKELNFQIELVSAE